MRKFEKIDYEFFKRDVCDDRELYDSIILPKRSTKHSVGYDIRSIENHIVKPGDSCVVKTGIKVCFNSDEVFYLFDRSSTGFKYDVLLSNGVGVFECDYYNNPDNDGQIFIKLINLGKNDYEIKIGDRIAQGVFMKYLTVDDEEEVTNIRKSGLGSTGKRD